ncbi:MAG TPA: hypothetical protein VNI57_07955, partial [Candidatus Saccharimonadales bacterium]|nr:hypothetical protein [Candidatus Saccharimonadales bacterium]
GFGAASEPAAAGVVRFAVDPPEGISMDSPFISPDGKVLAFTGRESADEGAQRPEPYIYTRRLDELESHRLDATRGVFASTFSADSHWLAFASSASPGSSVQQLRKVPVDGSAPPLVLAEWKSGWRSPIVWPVGEGILLTTSDGKLVRVAPDGSGAGEPLQMKLPEGLSTVGLRSPLPAPGKILASNDSWEGTGYHQEVDLVDAHTGEVRRILDNGTSARWSPTGHLVFTRNDTLLAMRADPVTFEPAGGVISLTDGLGTSTGDAGAAFALSQSGTLVHRTGGRWGMHRRIAILSLDGSLVPWSDDRLPFQDAIDVSPDGRWMAVTEMGDDLNFSVWISAMDKPRLRLLAAMPKMDCNNALWAPGSEAVYYTCSGRGGSGTVYRARPDSASPPEEIVSFSGRNNLIVPAAASPDGRWLLAREGGYLGSGESELMKVDLAADKRSLVPFGEDVRESWTAALSPDGRWLAYATRASGRSEIHLRRFAEDGTVGPPAIVTSGDIVAVGWSLEDGDGARDLLFWSRAGKLYKVRISTSPSLSIGDPVEILDGSKIHPSINTAAWMPDGRLLIVQQGEDEEVRRGAVVVVNWLEELKRLARSP